MLSFVIGLFVGSIVTTITLCLFFASKSNNHGE